MLILAHIFLTKIKCFAEYAKHFYFITILLLLFLPQFTFGQINLVPNPSFELYDTCPNSFDQIQHAIGWSSYLGSPDYYNSCEIPSTLGGVPNNAGGYQQPLNGNAYAGFQVYFGPSHYREILGCTLSSPLIIGQKYFVNFKVVNAGLLDPNMQGFNCCTNKIGARFSTLTYSYTAPTPINNFAHIYTDSIIKDTVNWHTISGSFIADSSYQYFAIGNFFDDAHTDTSRFSFTYICRAYYLIDGVCVSTDSAYAATWTTVGEIKKDENNIVAFPNPTNGITHIKYQEPEPPDISVYNSLGALVYPPIIYSQNNIQLNLNEQAEGIYFVRVKSKERTISKKIIIIK